MDAIRLRNFELHPADRRLLVDGQPVDIGGRAFDVLRVLAETPGRLVTKAALLERAWPRLVVDENNLPAQVAALRKVLGAGAIQTVPGFGYRLDCGAAESAVAASPLALPPTPNAEARPRSWPRRLAPLIGRDEDLSRIEAQLEEARLLTLVGTPGIGKSRLAEEILSRERVVPAAQAAFVALAPVTEPGHVPHAIAAALGLSLDPTLPVFDALERALGERPALVVLDSVEHLAAGLAPMLERLLSRQRSVRLLLTSQMPLGVAGEFVFRLEPLAVPATGAAEANTSAAVRLFAERAAAADRSFTLTSANAVLVADICRRLDGNPLALELAAARVPALGVAALHARLDDRMRLLRSSHGATDARHGTLRAAFEWSYSLLTAHERLAFDRLGVFAGSFALPMAAECVADAEVDDIEAIDLVARLVARLVDRSLITALPGEATRYVLSETARCFAREQLSQRGDLADAIGRMAHAVVRRMDAAYDEYWSIEEAVWRTRYLAELDNVRATLSWAMLHEPAVAIAVYGSTWPLYVELDLLPEARQTYDELMRLLGSTQPLARLGRFWEAAATCHSMARFDRARYCAELAARMYGEISDSRGRYYALTQLVTNWRSDNAAAHEAFAVARSLEDPEWPPRLLTHGALTECILMMAAGQLVEARDACRRAVRFALAVSERQALAATVRLVELDLACGDLHSALQLGRALAQTLRHSPHVALLIETLTLQCGAELRGGHLDEARATGAQLYHLARQGDVSRLHGALDAMALLACIEGYYDVAACVADDADRALSTRGLSQRRPADVPLRDAAEGLLIAHLGTSWRSVAQKARPRRDEAHSCALALGLEH